MSTIAAKVIKKHSDFLYVESGNILYECKVRERLKKEKIDIIVGDKVKIEEINPETNQAVITEVFERKNFISRPAIANIDQIVIVNSMSEPDLDFIQLNRYVCNAKFHNIPAIICINKIDIDKNPEKSKKIKNIYESLGCVVFTSALDGSGLDKFMKFIVNKTSVLCGMSGVGKSSLLNKIKPGLDLKTKTISSKSKKGIHTTRHVELISLNENTYVADSPGFSYLKFDNIMPAQIGKLFEEIDKLSSGCYFSDCLHLQEKKCNVLNNLDKIDETRYESYKTFVEEAFEYKKKITYSGTKKEEVTKTIDAAGRKKTTLIKLGKKDDPGY